MAIENRCLPTKATPKRWKNMWNKLLMLHASNSVPVLPFLLHFMLPEKQSRLSPEVARCVMVKNRYGEKPLCWKCTRYPRTQLHEHQHGLHHSGKQKREQWLPHQVITKGVPLQHFGKPPSASQLSSHKVHYCWLIGTYRFKRKYGWHAPQGLIIGAPTSQYASYSAMSCLLHNNKSKEQHEKHLCNPSSHYGKYGKYAREMCAPYLDRCESHSPSILAMSSLFHNVVSKA